MTETNSEQFNAQDKAEQLVLPNIDVEQERLYERIKSIGQSAVEALARDYEVAAFSYRDLVQFAAREGKKPQEAGKIFNRFYQGLAAADLELLPKNYEKNRDSFNYPLSLLSLVLSEAPDTADAYTELLRAYHRQRLEQLTRQP